MTHFDQARAERFLSPDRYRWQNPDNVLTALGVAPGITFVDVGAGPGFFTLPAAKRIGPAGKVYALDIESQMLDILKKRAIEEGVANIECLVSSDVKLPLPDAVADVVLVANVLHEVSSPLDLLREIARVIRPTGALGVVEWRKEQTEKGPPLAERLDPEEVTEALKAVGFAFIKAFEVGPHQYGLEANKEQTRHYYGPGLCGCSSL